MTLGRDAKLANVLGSLRDYVNTTLAATFSAGAAIDYGGGEPFPDTLYAEWLQVRLLEPARPARMRGPRGHVPDVLASDSGGSGPPYARELYHLLNLNVFVRPAKLATPNSLRLETLRDLVVAQFTPQTRIEVKDYAGEGASLGRMVVDRIDADRLVIDPQREGELLQWNLVIALRWAETWT